MTDKGLCALKRLLPGWEIKDDISWVDDDFGRDHLCGEIERAWLKQGPKRHIERHLWIGGCRLFLCDGTAVVHVQCETELDAWLDGLALHQANEAMK